MKPSRFFSIALVSVATLAASRARAETTKDAHAESHPAKPRSAMKADDFRKLVEKKIAAVKSAIEKKLDHHGVTAERRAKIRHFVDVAATEVRTAANKALADGIVSKEEAQKVRALAEQLRGKVRDQIRMEKSAKSSSSGDKRVKAGDKKKPAKKTGETRPAVRASADDQGE
jgi:hypothetical protein